MKEIKDPRTEGKTLRERITAMQDAGIPCQCCQSGKIKVELKNGQEGAAYLCGACHLKARRIQAEEGVRRHANFPKAYNRDERRRQDAKVKRLAKKLLAKCPLGWDQ